MDSPSDSSPAPGGGPLSGMNTADAVAPPQEVGLMAAWLVVQPWVRLSLRACRRAGCGAQPLPSKEFLPSRW